MTDKLRTEALGMGMDLVGFGPVERWKHAPYLLSPKAILPESKTVVVCGLHITDTWTEMGGEPEPQDRSPGGWRDQNALLDRVAYRLVRLLENYGYNAIAVASSNVWRYREFEGIPSIFAPDISHIHASAAAGLSQIGWHGLAINPEFGVRTRYISVITDAELTPTPLYDGPDLCDMCLECVKHCPTAALVKELKKPHELRIEDRVMRYANKNIWRCAWAEHFNIDLNSENLKKLETIGEAEVIDEIESKGYRGHARGVCQKVCVPPHLRSDEPSFGRPDKLIRQNRINKRYPDNMPTLRKLRDDISAAAIRMGADLVRVGALTRDLETTPGYTIQKELPGACTLIGIMWHMPKDIKDSGWAFTGMVQLCHQQQIRLERIIEDCGYHAAGYSSLSYPNGLGGTVAEMLEMGRVSADDASQVISDEFGDEALFFFIATDAPLDPTPPAGPSKPPVIRRLGSAQLRRRLEQAASLNYVSRFGIAPASRFDKAVEELSAGLDMEAIGEWVTDAAPRPHGKYEAKIVRETARVKTPEDYVPNAKSVIVLGLDFPGVIVANAGNAKSQQIGPYAFWQYQTRNELAFAAVELAKLLCEQGYRAVVTTDMLGIQSEIASHRGMIPDARCNSIEAVAAGFGRLGRHGALLSEEFGSRLRQIVIVTDAELPADAIELGQDYCKDCSVCAEVCPMSALPEKSITIHLDDTAINVPLVDRNRCDWSKRYSLCPEEGPAMIGNKTNPPRPEGAITIEMIADAMAYRDPVMRLRTCILETCLHKCPVGRREESQLRH